MARPTKWLDLIPVQAVVWMVVTLWMSQRRDPFLSYIDAAPGERGYREMVPPGATERDPLARANLQSEIAEFRALISQIFTPLVMAHRRSSSKAFHSEWEARRKSLFKIRPNARMRWNLPLQKAPAQ